MSSIDITGNSFLLRKVLLPHVISLDCSLLFSTGFLGQVSLVEISLTQPTLNLSFYFVTVDHVKSLNYLLRTGEEQTCIQLKKKKKQSKELHYNSESYKTH